MPIDVIGHPGQRSAVRPDHRELRASSLEVEGSLRHVLVPPADDGAIGREREALARSRERPWPAGPGAPIRPERVDGEPSLFRPGHGPHVDGAVGPDVHDPGIALALDRPAGPGRAGDGEGADDGQLIVDLACHVRHVGHPIGADGEVLDPAAADEIPRPPRLLSPRGVVQVELAPGAILEADQFVMPPSRETGRGGRRRWRRLWPGRGGGHRRRDRRRCGRGGRGRGRRRDRSRAGRVRLGLGAADDDPDGGDAGVLAHAARTTPRRRDTARRFAFMCRRWCCRLRRR